MRFFLSVSLILAGCTQGQTVRKQSVLVLAIARLNADDIECSSSGDSLTPRIDAICEEAVRFTHAYTPSVLTNPALGSILTGLFPKEHGVRENGSNSYSKSIKSLPELLQPFGVTSYFISGGPPSFRKSGISHGFHIFDDYVRGDGGLYRSASKVVDQFFSALESRGKSGDFFGVLYFSDLQFIEVVSEYSHESLEGVDSFTNKLKEVDGAIGIIVDRLKKEKLWDSTTVVITGVQGRATAQPGLKSRGIGLYDDFVRIPLIVKPMQKPADKSPGWKVDLPVSLVDIGKTLQEILKVSELSNKSEFPTVNVLAPSSESEKKTERPIYSESSVLLKRGWGPMMVSVRKGEWVYWKEPTPFLYNTFTDRAQRHNLYSKEYTGFQFLQADFEKYSGSQGKSSPIPTSLEDKLIVSKRIFSATSKSEEIVKDLNWLELRRPEDWQIVRWNVRIMIDTGDWIKLRTYLKQHRPIKEHLEEFNAWLSFVGQKLHIPKPDVISPICLELVTSIYRKNIKELSAWEDQTPCADKEVSLWVRSFVKFKLKKFSEASILQRFAGFTTKRRVELNALAKFYWMNDSTWDFPDSLPDGPGVLELGERLSSETEFMKYVKQTPAL